jgi:LmbE family N-acetylglucosaminyl deacetylase
MATYSVSELGTILSVWAHPDDETYLAGGLMAAARANGQRVVCVSATAGEQGTSDPVALPPVRLGAVRRKEAAAAMTVLGVREHRFLGFADGTLADDDERGLGSIADLIDEVQPDTIVTFGSDGTTFHPDHIAVHQWVTSAWERGDGRARLLYAAQTAEFLGRFRRFLEESGVYMADLRPVGLPSDAVAVELRLERAGMRKKLDALRAMPSQTSDLLNSLDHETLVSFVGEETFVEARYAAMNSSATYM